MQEWIDELTRSLAEEHGDKPRVAVVATVDAAGDPRARSLVCRRVGGDGSLWFTSDGRSEKNAQLKARPRAEAVFWLATVRRQFRVLGDVKALTADTADRWGAWEELSDASRALFFWPPPGAALDPAASFPQTVDRRTNPPASFEVLVLHARTVERLDLKAHPHHRRRWREEAGWGGEDVNP